MITSSKFIEGWVYIDGEKVAHITPPKCPLFSFCNCKTAMCRAVLPDESCYWYRYFKKLIEENERKI